MSLSACIKSATHTVYFFNVGSLLISLFSELIMLWSLVTITRIKTRVEQSASKCRNLPLQAKDWT